MESNNTTLRYYEKCVYMNCTNGKHNGKRLYCFPSQYSNRHIPWINNSGNVKLKKWSPSSIRRAGLCEDHFTADSFKNDKTKRLKRDAIPISYEEMTEDDNVEWVEDESNFEFIVDEDHEDVEPSQTLNSKFEVIEIEEPTASVIAVNSDENPLTVYQTDSKSEDSLEQEYEEWIDIEPSIEEHTTESCEETKQNTNTENEEKSTKFLQSTIQNLKQKNEMLQLENIKLRKQLRMLKYRIQYHTEKRRLIRRNEKQKEMLKRLIGNQKLNPVAKAMINLQLHTPNTPYSEAEKNLARQLYYLSDTAFSRLRKAGCNFPGRRTIKRWLEECGCETISKSSKEKKPSLSVIEKV